MKFLAANLLLEPPGSTRTDTERITGAVEWALWAERAGFDAVGIGERHAAPFLASAPTVLLSAIAAVTTRVRLVSTVTVLPLLDPVRVAEDFATLDHLSGGRVDLVIGKGNDPVQNRLFGHSLDEQWQLNREKYELLRRLWREERVTWSGSWRPALEEATTLPRPLQQPIPVWHGSASSTESTELAARFGEPLFSANAFHPTKKYTDLVAHYRERLAAHGHRPEAGVVGVGCGGLYVAERSQDAVEAVRPRYRAFLRSPAAQHNAPEFTDVEDAVERGPLLVGSPQQVAEKLARWHAEFSGVDVLQVGIEGLSLPADEQRANLSLFLETVAPVLRAELPSRVWPATAVPA
ncbi:LLM class flavin-dependent oxidoreductase [Geodermatophilus aquaeductus]|uniref:Flavin-dependent oxidoreductase, luciferase family (Includes alkanesulfonate monooxygenase SsuD and methylene tetrahydromethanopterin reductase) n=1 Tax=Geodermatophilus aquaeductus TaxID=1564161 RepID=A0A521FPQ8_9ACTN|nr:LLM class flavin-dependent oxidoreductase [Geodermatophilus aquaeductus]SMO98207.1 Flavin-dependent oxidoreductase, luciferase family (includes alkanesulfonate monooxygenase SsuD and methylene tetrahydromethanopterin reductase) [Geodermatophilus aquaeductus]